MAFQAAVDAIGTLGERTLATARCFMPSPNGGGLRALGRGRRRVGTSRAGGGLGGHERRVAATKAGELPQRPGRRRTAYSSSGSDGLVARAGKSAVIRVVLSKRRRDGNTLQIGLRRWDCEPESREVSHQFSPFSQNVARSALAMARPGAPDPGRHGLPAESRSAEMITRQSLGTPANNFRKEYL